MISVSKTASTLGSAFGGALIGILVACVIKGALIGLSQTSYGFSWFSVIIGALSGPVLLLPDLLMLWSTGSTRSLVVLPWALAGCILGALCGILSLRSIDSEGPGSDAAADGGANRAGDDDGD
jgi:hypothetical protein